MFAGFGNDSIDASGQSIGVTVYGSGGNDTILGSAFDDNLWGGAGNDSLAGNDGNDLLFGDVDADSLSGGNGNDTIYAEGVDTLIQGGGGTDFLYWVGASAANLNMAGASIEWAQSLGTNDTFNGSTSLAALTVYAGDGSDNAFGGSAGDFLWGEGGADVLAGNFGNDTLVGGIGADQLTGGDGTDTLYGTNGGIPDGTPDTFFFGFNWGTDFVYDFEHDIDTINMQGSGAANFGQLSVTNSGAHANVAFGGNLIVVVNAAGLIDAGDFAF